MDVLRALVLENIFRNFYGKKEKKLMAFYILIKWCQNFPNKVQ